MKHTEHSPDVVDDGRYRTIEYNGAAGTVTIIQDTENSAAWIQSDSPVEVVP